MTLRTPLVFLLGFTAGCWFLGGHILLGTLCLTTAVIWIFKK